MKNLALSASVKDLQNIHKPLPIARHLHIHRHETEMELDDPATFIDSSSESSSTERSPGPLKVHFDDETTDRPKMNWMQWDMNERNPETIPNCLKATVVSDSDTDDAEDEDALLTHKKPNNVFTDKSATTSKPRRQHFWERQDPENLFTLGFNSAKTVKPVNPDAPIGARGRPLTNPKDKVQCNVCGSIYGRLSGTNHRKSKKHINAYNLNQRMVEAMLTMRKRRYYYKDEDESVK